MLHSFISILLSYVFLSALGRHKCMNYNARTLPFEHVKDNHLLMAEKGK